MINSPNLSAPLSPRENVKGIKARSRYIFIIPVALFLILGIVAVVVMSVVNPFQKSEKFSTTETKTQINDGSLKLTFGGYEVCDWTKIEFDTHVPLFVDGEEDGFFDSEDDILLEGFLCGTQNEVVLALDAEGLRGTISVNGETETIISAINSDVSEVTDVVREMPSYGEESEKVSEVAKKWEEHMSKQAGKRRSLTELPAGSVDIHLHLDIDFHMVETFGTAFAAARYGVELVAIVNRDAYVDVGFNLKVASINVRTSYLSSTGTPSAYLDALERIPRPANVNLLHSLSTRRLGGGVAYLGGLYSTNFCYGVSGSLNGGFSSWDRIVVAHELGHNFGSGHTHSYDPPIDTCGNSCPASPIGTIMSYCHLCSGGLSNIRYEWADRVRQTFLDAYASQNHLLARRTECSSVSVIPDIGVPFYFKGETCLNIDTANCQDCDFQDCSLDSVWQFDGSRIVSLQNTQYCWSADCFSSTISLQICNDEPAQRFSFEGNNVVNAQCGSVTYSGETAGVTDSTPVSSWCYPDASPSDAGECDQTTIPLTCGQVHTGSTANDCDDRRFSFVAPAVPVTISTCQSSFDTMLSVETSNERVAQNDDSPVCGRQSVLSDLSLTAGEEHFIVLSGFSGESGNYRIELTCSVPGLTPTQDPTMEPDCDSEIIEAQCGDILTGSTTQSCQAEQRFAFTARAGLTTITTCGSDFDTTLTVETGNDQVTFQDDSPECGLFSHIDDLTLNEGQRYTITLGGYNNARGNYRLGLECADSLRPTSDPTFTVTSEPTTSGPTLDPTSDPTFTVTSEPTTSVYGCVFGCEQSTTTCGNRHRISTPCERRSSCTLDECLAHCDTNENCRFAFSTIRGWCHLYDDCSRTRQSPRPGFTRQRLVNGGPSDGPSLDPTSDPTFMVTSESTTSGPTFEPTSEPTFMVTSESTTSGPTFEPTSEPTQPTDLTWENQGSGKCQTLSGEDPTYIYRGGVGLQSCQTMCASRADCYGFSASSYGNCLLWTQPDIMGGGNQWGNAQCILKRSAQ